MIIRKFIDRRGQYRFTKKGNNGEPITMTSQGYKTARSRDNALQLDLTTPLDQIKLIGDDGEVEELEW